MSDLKLKTIMINNKDYDVFVTESGNFYGEVDGVRYNKPDLDELVTVMCRAARIKSARVSVKAHAVVGGLSNSEVRGCTLVGIHARNGTVLVKWDDTKTSGAGALQALTETFLKLTEEEVDKLKHLLETQKEVNNTVRDFLKVHTFDGRKAVREALLASGVTDKELGIVGTIKT